MTIRQIHKYKNARECEITLPVSRARQYLENRNNLKDFVAPARLQLVTAQLNG